MPLSGLTGIRRRPLTPRTTRDEHPCSTDETKALT